MGYTRARFKQRGFDGSDYGRYFQRYQKEYQRTRLRCVNLYQQGKAFEQIASACGIHARTAREVINLYIAEGFEGLCRPIVRPRKSRLDAQQLALLKEVILHKRPCELGLAGNIWTGDLMCAYIRITWNVAYSKGIYVLLKRIGLTHQKAHADYGKAKQQQQAAFIKDLKDTILEADEYTAVLTFDEFSVCEKPTSYYGWAQKNTRPKVKTDEKKQDAAMGC